MKQNNFGSANISTKQAKSILNKASGFNKGYDFTLNPYQGCQYQCSYCYAAAFTRNKEMRDDWGNWVIIKENVAKLVEKELDKWQRKNIGKHPAIYMSTVTDAYQAIESKTYLTQDVLKVMLKYQPTLVIQTRSPLITRDIDILRQFDHLRINISIPTGSEEVKQDFERRSPSIKARLKTVNFLKQNKGKVSVTITPTLPTFPEDEDSFINQLGIADRVVLHKFLASGKIFCSSTRDEALVLKQKYAWWYDNEADSYEQLKAKLMAMLPNIEFMEGKQGFQY